MAQDAAVPIETIRELARQIAQEEVKKFARSSFLNNASVTGGAGVTIKDGGAFRANYPDDLGGGAMLYVGRIVSTVDGSYKGTGLLLQAPDGTDIAVFRTDTEFGFSRSEIYDSAGRVIFANDGASQMGLARPYLPLVFYPAVLGAVPQTTSTSFTTLWWATTYKQQPRVIVGAAAVLDTAGAAGELRVMVNGVQLGATQSVTSAAGSWIFGAAPVAGDHMSNVLVEIQARRTGAAGTVYAVPQFGATLQS